MYTPSVVAISFRKTWLKHLQRHYTYHFCITDAFPKWLNAPEGSSSNAIRQGEMLYINLPNVARQKILETGLDNLWTCPRHLISCLH